jgi:hypothetical protein
VRALWAREPPDGPVPVARQRLPRGEPQPAGQ